MALTRTVKVKLGLLLDVAQAVVRAYTDACNYASQVAFGLERPSAAIHLHRVVYHDLRTRFGLSAQVAQSVTAKYAALQQAKKKPKKPVRFNGEPVQLQGCSRCGYADRANRSGLAFQCKACGYTLHADLNAARNIRWRGILARQVLGGDGPLSAGPQARESSLASSSTGKLAA